MAQCDYLAYTFVFTAHQVTEASNIVCLKLQSLGG